jgi:integrase
MQQRGQMLELKTTGPDGRRLWAYRYRPDGRDSKRLQRGGFTSAEAAHAAVVRVIKRAEHRRLHSRALTLADLADEYLAQHDAQPETTAKLRWLLSKSISVFGTRPIVDLEAREIAHWRMALPAGHRFEATQALRQVLARAVAWGLLETNPAKVGVDNPPPKRREMLPLEPPQLRAVVAALGPRYGPMVRFAAATGLRPGEWLALEWRDIDPHARVLHVRRAFRIDRIKTPKTDAPRTVPLQRTALDALAVLPGRRDERALLFPAPEGGYLDLHNWRPRHWRPAQREAGITPLRRLYDLRHTFATSALRAGLGTFELSRYMGTSLVNIDRTYGHLAHDGHAHAVELLDGYGQEAAVVDVGGRFVDVASPTVMAAASQKTA